jgi:hypothetical protein
MEPYWGHSNEKLLYIVEMGKIAQEGKTSQTMPNRIESFTILYRRNSEKKEKRGRKLWRRKLD